MKVGIVKDLDITERPGGAQRAMQLFEHAAPPDAELIRLRPGQVVDSDCDLYITGNVKLFGDEDLEYIANHADRHIRYQFDLWDDAPNASMWAKVLNEHAMIVMYPSPFYRELFIRSWGITNFEGSRSICLAPPIDPAPLKPYRLKYDELGRTGACYFGEVHPLKGVDIAIRWWLAQNGDPNGWPANGQRPVLDVYGPLSYQFRQVPWWQYRGCPDQETLYDEVAKHEYLIHMPRKADGFSMTILEAMLLGLKVVASGKLGIESWMPYCKQGGMEELIEKCVLAPTTFWELVQGRN